MFCEGMADDVTETDAELREYTSDYECSELKISKLVAEGISKTAKLPTEQGGSSGATPIVFLTRVYCTKYRETFSHWGDGGGRLNPIVTLLPIK